jgi:hypothetical protein
MSLKPAIMRDLLHTLQEFHLEHLARWWQLSVGWPPSSPEEFVEPDDQTVMSLVADTVRLAGYPATLGPQTLGEAYRMLVQLARDRQAEKVTADLQSQLPPGITLGFTKYILYLRSFEAPLTLPMFPTDWGTLSLEEALAFTLSSGPWPLVGLGKQHTIALGAGKIRSADDTWQRELRKLSLNATLILVVPSITAGTSWEVEWVAINDNLRNSIFLMPPSADDNARRIWDSEWTAVQRWGRFMGLQFPDYDPKGLLFTVKPHGPTLKSISFGEWFARGPWWIGLMELTGPSADWIGDIQRGVQVALEGREAKQRGIDLFQVHDEQMEEKRNSLRSRLKAIGTAADAKYFPVFEALDTIAESVGLSRGIRPGHRFSEWPPDDQSGFEKPGAYTVWWGTNDLIWAGATNNLTQEMRVCAAGDVSTSGFCQAVFTRLIEPNLTSEIKADLDAGLIQKNKMARFVIHKHLSAKLNVTRDIVEAKRLAHLINRGVLSAGKPRLRPTAVGRTARK